MARRASPPSRSRKRTGHAGKSFERLVDIMATLRSPSGCAWDRKQTHESLRGYLIEETYEAVDAIDRGNLDELKGELGDVLLQCVFHAQLADENGRFDIANVADAISDKLVRRHPHVFAPDGRRLTARERVRNPTDTPEAVREQWARLKASEQSDGERPARVLAGIPRALPALLRAHKIGTRVAAVGFDWTTPGAVVDKIDEEARELRAALAEHPKRVAEEMGDLLFSVANLARHLGLDPEAELSAANDKFTRRFDAVEAWFEARGRSVHGAAPEELDEAWRAAKVSSAAAPARSRSGRSRSARAPSRRRTQSSPRRRGRS